MTERRIGQYLVIDTIGRGAFATVFRCLDERLGAEVAVKLLADNHSLEPEIRARFVSEGRTLRRVDNRHVVQVYDVGETDTGQPFLVLELADGGDLENRRTALRQVGWKASPDDVLAVVSALSDALEALHANGLVHRDLSPANLLIRSGGERSDHRSDAPLLAAGDRLLVADLGLVKDLAAHSGITLGAGTERFMAPEQRRTGAIDQRADIYAFGRIVEWLIEGHGASPPRWVDAMRAAIGSAVAEDPAHRPASASDFAAMVSSAILDNLEPTLGEPGSGTPRVAPQRGLVWIVASLVTLVTVAAVAWATTREPTVTTELSDGTTRVALVQPGLEASVEGPSSLEVGSDAVFRAQVDGHRSFAWVLPGGERYESVPAVRVRAVSPGSNALVLTVVDADGETHEIVFEFDVVESR